MRTLIFPLLAAAGLATAHAFMPNPDLLTISPPLAKAGSTVEVTIAGTNLDEARTLRFADSRFQVEPVTLPADEFFPEARPVANRFNVTIPDDVEPGIYEVRSLGYFGLSTARPFLVVARDAVETREVGDHSSRETAMPLEIETGVLGSADNQRVDWFQFAGKAGQRLLIQVWAERLDSRADCQLAVYDPEGRELESNRDHFGLDPLVDFTPPADGDYFIALSDTLYRGSAQYFYRLQVSRGPLVDFAFPPAVETGQTRKITLFGRNLPGGSLDRRLTLAGKPLETLEVVVQAPAQPATLPGIQTGTPRQGILPGFLPRVPSPVKVGFATAPVVIEDPDSERQTVSVPSEIAGRFDEPGDSDRFRIAVKKGETVWIEAICDRLGSVADPVVSVQKISAGADGQEARTQVAENDDPPSFYGADSLDDLNANTLDSSVHFTADADGDYVVTIINQSAGGSPAHLYRLAIRHPQPDFQLIAGTERTKTINNDAYPAAPLLRRGGAMVYRILALRQDGFEGDIVVEARGLPEGVTAPPLVMSGKTTEGYLALQASPSAPAWSGPVHIYGTAKIGDREVRQEARNGALIWGCRVFANQRQVRSRLDEEIVLSVLNAETEPSTLAPAEDKTWSVELNQTLEIPFIVTDVGQRKGSLQVEAFGFPGMLRNPPKASIAEGKSTEKLTFNFKPNGNFKIEPGKYQFVLQGVGNAIYRQNPAAAERAATEVKRLDALAKAFAEEARKAKAAVANAQKALEEAKKLTSAAEDAVKAAQTQLSQASATATAAEAKITKLAQRKKTAEATVKAASETAKEKTNQFATYSLPISVEVTAPEKK